jgi:Fe-S cluster assembly protein SufD
MSATALDQDLFAATVGAMPNDGLTAIRSSGADAFAQSGFPTTIDENWKYTNLSGAADISNAWFRENTGNVDTAISASPPGEAQTGVIEQIDAHWLLIRNGSVDSASLQRIQDELGSAVVVCRLSERSEEQPIDIGDPMSAFNAALLRDGLHISIGENTHPTKPLGILQVDHSALPASQIRIVIDLAGSSSLSVIECALSESSDAQFTNAVTQARIGPEATLSYVRLQQRSTQHIGVSRFIANLDRDARLRHNAFDFGGALTRNDVVANIAGANAAVHLHGLYLASGTQHIDNHTRVEHRVGPAVSHEEYRGVLNGRSRCVFNGQAVVFEGADGTDANQENHNLLLSEHAEIDTKPELEIYADDVKCSHGATVGQLDDASLFYLRTRGLDQDEARRLLTKAFAARILDGLAVEECRDFVASELDKRLAKLVDDALT